MDCLFGLVGKDFVLIAADTLSIRSIAVMKHNQNKIKPLNDYNLLAYAGEGGDTFVFAEYVQKNIQLYGIRNSLCLPPKPTACYTRRLLADALRTREAYQVNVLVGGFDQAEGRGKLYWIDYLAAMADVPFAAHGYGAYFCLSLMDRLYKPDMDVEQAKELLRKCIQELKVRFLVNFTSFSVKLVNKDGIQEVTL
jgi:20S proteasome subunit beta 4